VFPRLCYIGFTFAQPFLVSATLSWSEHPEGSDDADEGYGLIGAWFLVYVGIAVRADHAGLLFAAALHQVCFLLHVFSLVSIIFFFDISPPPC
jgi:hypothetical protein